MADISLTTVLSGVTTMAIVGLATWVYGMAQRVTSVETKISLFWSMIEKQTSQLLHSPHRPALDRLLDKSHAGERLTKGEAAQLVDLLQRLIDTDELSADEKAGAWMLMAVTVANYELPI